MSLDEERRFVEALGIDPANILAGSVRVERLANAETVGISYECVAIRTVNEVHAALDAST